MNENYSNRELDHVFNDIHAKLDTMRDEANVRKDEFERQFTLILDQTTKHNGRMSRMEKTLLVVGTVIVVLLIVNGSKFVSFLGLIL